VNIEERNELYGENRVGRLIFGRESRESNAHF